MHDIHTHLYWESYDADRDAVIARAHAAGVEKMFAIGCTVEESRRCVALAEQYPEIFASVGLHPNELNHESSIMNQELVQELRMLAQHEKVVAIGECGLDYYRRGEERPVTDEEKKRQKECFILQSSLACELGLPVIVHCRPSMASMDAYEDMCEILQDQYSQFSNHDSCFILHCYMGDTDITKHFLTLPNVYFSFAGNITYPVKKGLVGTKDDLRDTVRMIPLERMLAETDCPFLASQSHRGERNEPAYVVEVVQQIARLCGWDTAVVRDTMSSSIEDIFFKA